MTSSEPKKCCCGGKYPNFKVHTSQKCYSQFQDTREEEGLEKTINAAVNSWLSVKDNGEEYMNFEDITNLKKHLTELFAALLHAREGEDWRKQFDQQFNGDAEVWEYGMVAGLKEIKSFISALLASEREAAENKMAEDYALILQKERERILAALPLSEGYREGKYKLKVKRLLKDL